MAASRRLALARDGGLGLELRAPGEDRVGEHVVEDLVRRLRFRAVDGAQDRVPREHVEHELELGLRGADPADRSRVPCAILVPDGVTR